jgi:cytochrome c oxidase subunit III
MASITVAERVGHFGGSPPGGATGGRDRDGGNRSRWVVGMPDSVYMTGLLVALCGIAMFFAALASAYVVRKGLAQNDWRVFVVPRILWLNTAILLASSLTLVFASMRQRVHDTTGFRHWWVVTAALGGLFLLGQLIAWRQMAGAGLYLATNPAAGFFYIFTAAHGAHLLVGLAALVAICARAPKRMTPKTASRVAAAYWHFLTALWLLLLLFLVYER